MTTWRIVVTLLVLMGSCSLDASAQRVDCTCKLTLIKHQSSNPDDFRALEISELTTSQRTEQFNERISVTKSCKAHCRESFGIESSGVSQAARRAKRRLAKKAEELGQPFNWCGGWLSAQLDSKGAFGWRINIAPGTIGVTPVRTCSSVPPGLARGCCCGSNHIIVFRETFPNYEWALGSEGHFLRFWWDQQGRSEVVEYGKFSEPLVSGSLMRDPFGDGAVALNEEGFIVRTVEKRGKWSTSFLAREVIHNYGGVLPCGMITTSQPKFRGIWAITESRIVKFEMKGGRWSHTSVEIGSAAARIDTSSLYEIGTGRIAGAMDDGRRWNVWFENNDPKKMRFAFSGGRIAVSPSARCEHTANDLRLVPAVDGTE